MVGVFNQHSSFYKCQNSYHGMKWARMICVIVDKFMATFPASFVLGSVLLYCFSRETQCRSDMPYHNFINEIFFYDFWTKSMNGWAQSNEHTLWDWEKWQSSNIVQRNHFVFQVHTFCSCFLLFSPYTLALPYFHSTLRINIFF